VGGSTPFSIESTDQFERSFRKLQKSQPKGVDSKLVDKVSDIIESLIDNQRPLSSRSEPFPSNLRLPDEWEFRKIEFSIGKGASGQIRLMYLIDSSICCIRLLWIYSHEQFAKRPTDKDLKTAINEIVDP
jgi:mRNA-degrading endonuclease YafQ of YafQ-DinJ toxin-antitoxin module